jgi:hypothetical protein
MRDKITAPLRKGSNATASMHANISRAGAGGGGDSGSVKLHNELQLMPIRSIITIVRGKETPVLQRKESHTRDVDPGVCLSLVTPSRSLDLQCTNAVECETLLRGFRLLAFGDPTEQRRRKMIQPSKASGVHRW